jgi:2-oxoglutarate ferredoxin oxidoreductase subunit alpha
VISETDQHSAPPIQELERVTIRFAGDSGDGMQLTGSQFTRTAAVFGNDIATLPDFPAEIRAPAGSLAGVSGFQISFSSTEIHTPGDSPDVLVAMNPAALKANLRDMPPGGAIVVNEDAFNKQNLAKADYETNPLEDGSLKDFNVFEIPISTLNARALEGLGMSTKQVDMTKNFFALGVMFWLYERSMDPTIKWIESKFGDRPVIAEGNLRALKAGYAFGETTEMFHTHFRVRPARQAPGTYRNITGNEAAALGFVAASRLAGRELFYGSYPITPASDILHQLSTYKHFGVRTFQAEDEIAACGAALGAAFAGHLGVTSTSGPGVALKSETMSLAISLELPLLLVDIQRGGPSTGLPTKTEAADLLIALYGRHAEAPLPVVAAFSPTHCFFAAIEAARLALKYRTPVILLSDGYLANGAEPWRLPDVADLPDISVPFATETNHVGDDGTPESWPYLPDPEALARPWAIPGTPGLQHRVGGLEKEDGTGNIDYTPENHSKMVRLRAAKVAGIANDIPPATVEGDEDAELLIVGWGSTWAAIDAAVQQARRRGRKVAWTHLIHLNPLPANLGDIVRRYPKILMPELNLGQLSKVVRAEFLVDAKSTSKVRGLPFFAGEIERAILELLGDTDD